MKNSIFNLNRIERNNTVVLFNTLTKNKIILLYADYIKYRNQDYDCLEKGVLFQLQRRGFIIRDDFDEIEFLKKNKWSYINRSDELRITLIPSFQCNFHCPYCFEREEQKSNEVINFEILKKYVDNTLTNIERLYVTLFGGEPTLFLDEIVDWFDYINAVRGDTLNISTIIATNGYLLSAKMAETLINRCHLKCIQITIECSINMQNKMRDYAGKDSFSKIVHNIIELVQLKGQYDVDIILRVNVYKGSILELEEMLDVIPYDKRSLINLYFRPIYDTNTFKVNEFSDYSISEAMQLAKSLGFGLVNVMRVKRTHCDADDGRMSYHILPDLSLTKCVNERGIGWKYGKINDDGFVVDTNEQEGLQLQCFDDEECVKCALLPICYGGCPYYYLRNGTRKCMTEKDIKIWF